MQSDMKPETKPETATSSDRRGSWLPTMLVSALVVAFLGTFLVVGSILVRDRALGAAAHPTPSPTAGAGILLTPLRPATAFTLTDQNGQALSLQSLRGHVVVLTFMDATCTQECPIAVQYLNLTTQFLGPQKTAQVEWVTISVNPNNTPAQAVAFLATHKAAMQMRFLLGTQAQLAPLWKAYGVAVIPEANDIAHTSGLYLLDRQGRKVEWVDMPFDSKALAADLSQLLAR